VKNAVFWDIKIPFIPHRRHITSPLQSPAGLCNVRFEVFTAVTVKNGVFCDVMPCGSCKNRPLVFLRSVRRLLVASCHPDEGGATFARNVRSFKGHTA
jgi:hypothetical protein